MHLATLLLIILGAGLASQWLAWQLRLPAIIVLILSGLVLGPVTGVVEPTLARSELAELIGLGVAIILFEGGMDLKLGEFRKVGGGVRRLTLLGPPLAWLLGALAAHYIAGLSWPVALVLGAILVVTGPTVIQPLLRQGSLNNDSASLLKWEGIVNDPVGVLLAVLTFQYFTLQDAGPLQTMQALLLALGIAALLGGVGGWATGWLYQRGAVPAHLKAPLLLVLVLLVFQASNQVQHEAGLLSVTLMGMVIGNRDLVERHTLQQFKENLTVLLLAVLFIVIPSQLAVGHLQWLDWRAGLFVLAVLLLVRPVSILLATLGAPMRSRDRWLLAWIAPRGIVAAATAGLFGPALVDAGYPDAAALLPLVFLVILVTVLAHGLTLGPLARRLDLAAESSEGLLIIGGSAWSRALAPVLRNLGVEVLVVDGSWRRLQSLRMDGVPVWYGEILSEHAELELEDEHLGHLLCATDNDYYNALVCKAMGHEFGHHRCFQLGPDSEAGKEEKRLTLQQRGYYAFRPATDLAALEERLESGGAIRVTPLDEPWNEEKWENGRYRESILLGAVSPGGELRLCSPEQPFSAPAGWQLLHLA